DLGLSVVAILDGEPVGLSLAAREGDEAWIGGCGIAEPFRRRGLATQMMQAHVERLDAAGIVRTRLEVLDGDPAEEGYRRAGFTRSRELLVLEGEVDRESEAGLELGRGELARAHARLHVEETSWRRSLGRVIATLAEFPQAEITGVRRQGKIVAYAVVID